MPNPTGWVDPLGLSCIEGGCPGLDGNDSRAESPTDQIKKSFDGPLPPAHQSQETIRVRHYTNSKGLIGIELDGENNVKTTIESM